MELKKIISLSVGAVVALLVLMAVAVPVIGSYTNSERVVSNDGVPYALSSEDDDATHTIRIEVDEDGERHIYVDGVEIETKDYDYSMIIGDTRVIRYIPGNGRLVYLTNNIGTICYVDSPGDYYEFSITGIVANGSGVIDGAPTSTYTVSNVRAYFNTSGDMVMADRPYVRADSYILGAGVTYSPFSTGTVLVFDGTMGEINAHTLRPADAVVDSVSVDSVNMYTQLVRINGINFDVTESGSQKTATYTYFLVPDTVTVDNPDYAGSQLSGIIGLVPLLMLVAVILVIVGSIALRPRD